MRLFSEFLLSNSVLDGWSVLLQPGLERSDISLTIVRNTFFVIFWIEDQGWVASNLNSFGLIGSSIELTNYEIWVSGHLGGELLPWLSELFAVTAPWGIVLDEDILGGILDNLIVFLSDNDLNWLVVLLWDWLGLEAWGKLSSKDIINEGRDGLDGQVSWLSWALVFLHAVWNDGSQSWEGFLTNSNELSESLLDSLSDIGVAEEHLSLVSLGSLLESGHEGGVLIGGIASE